jgi:Protein of unknown function (DUF1559)
MAHDDDFEDDDRPRRGRPRDDDDRSARSRRRYDDDDDRAPPRKKSGTGVIVGILVGVFIVCCGGGGLAGYYLVRGVKKGVAQIEEMAAGANESQQNLQNLNQIGSAAHKYHDAMAKFPNNSYETQGKQSRPLLSWRVHLLPQLGEDALYKQFKMDEPWDGPNNKKLLSQMPMVYGTFEARRKAGEGKTYYRGFSHQGAMFEKPPAPGQQPPTIRMADVQDGVSNTILVIEAGEPVEWTKPDDIDWSPGKPRPALGYAPDTWQFFTVLTADGRTRQVSKLIPDNVLRLLITRNDGQAIPAGWIQ